MDSKKDTQQEKAKMAPEPDKAKSAATAQASSQPSSARASSRSQAPKSVDESMKELASLFFQIKRAETSGKALTQAQTDRAKELVQDLQAAEIKFYGIISKCWISGNDCHMLDSNLEIMRHFSPKESVPEGFEKARKLIPGLSTQAVGLLVYSHQIQCLYLDGSTQVVENSNA